MGLCAYLCSIFPPAQLVNKWRRLGKFTSGGDSPHGSVMPPWTYKYKDLMLADGIQSSEDIEYVEDDMFACKLHFKRLYCKSSVTFHENISFH